MTSQEEKLPQNLANYTPLSPLSFLRRAADVYPELLSVIHGSRRYTWGQTYERCVRLASALSNLGVKSGETVSIIAPNIPETFEAHYGVPMCGAVLNAINTRLDAATIAQILEHAESRILLCDRELSAVIEEALSKLAEPPIIIDIEDSELRQPLPGKSLGELDYESFLQTGDPDYTWHLPEDEWQAIALNYTSGTTGNPKGVVYHHRGAYLNAVSNISGWTMPKECTYLWTLPMFHCNGWCFPWTLAAIAGTSVCLRTISADTIYNAISEENVTHMCGAPIIMNMICNAVDSEKRNLSQTVHMMTAAAPPPAAVLENIESMGFDITHVYGLTETYGPAVICAWKNKWNDLGAQERAKLKARQGVRYQMLEGLDILDPETLKPVPRDGETIGEIMFRGNIVMKGYFKNPEATDAAFKGGWFHSGDLGVIDKDGYLRILDRSKDIIISGGENISSIEIEDVLYTHPDIMEAAVAARPDDKWGETPCAFVSLRKDAKITEDELIAYCRDNMAHFKCPKTIVFCELPKTSTGKVQKFKLREQAMALGSL